MPIIQDDYNEIKKKVVKPSVNLGISKTMAKSTVTQPSYNLGINKQAAQASNEVTNPVSPLNALVSPVQKSYAPTTQTVYTPPDLSGYDRAWGQNLDKFNLQSNQLDQSNQLYMSQLDQSNQLYMSQLDQSYKNALGQLSEQEREEENQTGRLAQQAYIARKQAERVLPNQLNASGLANTGYENIAQQGVQNQYQSQYDQFMNNLAQAKAAIKRSRDSQNLNYNQNREGQSLNYNQNRESQASNYNQNKESMNLNKSQAYADYQYQIQQAQANAYKTVTSGGSGGNDSKVITQKANSFDSTVKTALTYGTPDRAWDYLSTQVKNKSISKEQAERIYKEFGQYWSYYNE